MRKDVRSPSGLKKKNLRSPLKLNSEGIRLLTPSELSLANGASLDPCHSGGAVTTCPDV